MKKTQKQIAAMICVILLVLLYVLTLIVAVLDFPGSDRMFAACLTATIGLPILLWIYIWMYGRFLDRHTIADPPGKAEAKAEAWEENIPDDKEEP